MTTASISDLRAFSKVNDRLSLVSGSSYTISDADFEQTLRVNQAANLTFIFPKTTLHRSRGALQREDGSTGDVRFDTFDGAAVTFRTIPRDCLIVSMNGIVTWWCLNPTGLAPTIYLAGSLE